MPEMHISILSNWPIGEVVSVEEMPSYWGKASAITVSDGTDYVLKERGSPSDVEREEALLSHLGPHGIPVAVPLSTTDNVPFAVHDGRTFALYLRLPGSVISNHYSAGAEARTAAFGTALASLHAALKAFANPEQFGKLSLIEHIVHWAVPTIERYPDSVNVERTRAIASDFEKTLSFMYADLPAQLIHRDPNPSNMLFKDGKLTGFLDFDLATRCARVFDPCYCSTSILVGGWQLPENRTTWLVLLRELMRGYAQYSDLTETERHAGFPMLLAIQLMFMAFSLNAGHSSAAQCNEQVLFWLMDNRKSIETQMAKETSSQRMEPTR